LLMSSIPGPKQRSRSPSSALAVIATTVVFQPPDGVSHSSLKAIHLRHLQSISTTS
jgi:hypothetical protein